jgi:hypothetical protein
MSGILCVGRVRRAVSRRNVARRMRNKVPGLRERAIALRNHVSRSRSAVVFPPAEVWRRRNHVLHVLNSVV